MQQDVLFTGVFSSQSSLITRLANEFMQGVREFLKNPSEYLRHAFADPAFRDPRRRNLLQFGLALAFTLYVLVFASVLTLWVLNHKLGPSNQAQLSVIPLRSLPASPGEPPVAKGDSDPHGGGGGGNKESTPATAGTLPPFDPTPAMVAPTTHPTINPPSLAVSETLLGNPQLSIPRDLSAPTGLPDGVVAPPSDGPGSDGGIGNGRDRGVGNDEGPGHGPGRNGGIGGNEYNDPKAGSRDAPAPKVDSPPVAMNRPRPNYTEEARAHKVQGIVRARILIGADGLVKQVRVIRPLQDGLTEEAIRATQQMIFQPAMKGGSAVAYWLTIDVEFNLR